MAQVAEEVIPSPGAGGGEESGDHPDLVEHRKEAQDTESLGKQKGTGNMK